MNIEELLIQSLQLLGLGMGSVFVILISLICIITLISRLIPEVEVAKPSPAPTIGDPGTEHIAAIQAAIHRYRSSHS